MAKQNFIFGQFSHYKALLFRRFTVYRRTYKSLLKSFLGVLIFAAIGAILQGMMINTSEGTFEPITYNAFGKSKKNNFIYVGKNDTEFAQQIINNIQFQYKNDTEKNPIATYYNTIEEMNEDIFSQVSQKSCHLQTPFGIYFKNPSEFPYSLSILYNYSSSDGGLDKSSIQTYSNALIANMLYREELGNSASFDVRFMGMNLKML